MFEYIFNNKRYKFNKIEELTAEKIVSFTEELDSFAVRQIKETSKFEKFLSSAEKEDILLLKKKDLISSSEALNTEKVTFSDIYDGSIESVGMGFFIGNAPEEYLLKHIGELLNSYSLRDKVLSFELSKDVNMNIISEDYGDYIIEFSEEKKGNSVFIYSEYVFSIEVKNKALIINGKILEIKIPEEFKIEKLSPLVKELSKKALVNMKRLESRKKNKEASAPTQVNIQEEGMDPLVAGGIGAVLGIALFG